MTYVTIVNISLLLTGQWKEPRVTHCIFSRKRGVVVSGVRRMNEVNAGRARQARGVLAWLSVG